MEEELTVEQLNYMWLKQQQEELLAHEEGMIEELPEQFELEPINQAPVYHS